MFLPLSKSSRDLRTDAFPGEDLKQQGMGDAAVDDIDLHAARLDFTHAFSSSGGLPCTK